MSSSKIFLYLCLSFIIGVFIASIISLSWQFLAGFLILGLALVSVFWEKKKIVVAGFCFVFLFFGISRQSLVDSKFLKSQNLALKEKITLIGIIDAEPEIKEKSLSFIIKTEQILTKEEIINFSQKILVNVSRYPEYKYGDRLEITGILEKPSEDINGFNYKNYLKKDGIAFIINWPDIEFLDSDHGSALFKTLFTFKNRLKQSSNTFLSPPESGLLAALFFGDEENISKEWRDKFNITGTRHITAVSGMNITIISALIFSFLLGIGFWRQQAFYLSIFLIVFYILMIGASASAVRAGIMGIIFLTAQYLGRASQADRAVVVAAFLMLLINPFLLKFDVGFQLSFLAILGLVYWQNFLSDILKKVPNVFQLRLTLAATLSAQVFVLPLLVYNFGRFSLISPLVNVLIVPFLSFITVLGFVFSLAGIFLPLLGQILSWPVWLFLTYILRVIDFFSGPSFASINIVKLHWFFPVLAYAFLAFLTRRIKIKERFKFLNY